MTPYNFSILLFSFSTFLLSVLVWLKRRDHIGNLYFFYMLTTVIWGIGYSVMASPNVSVAMATLAIRISNASAMFIPVTFYHFSLAYTQNWSRNKKSWLFFQYGLALFVLAFAFSDKFIPSVRPVMFFPHYPYPGPIYYLFAFSFFSILPFPFFELFNKMRGQKTEDKIQLRGILICSIFGYLGGSLALFPVFDIYVPQYALFLMPLYPFGIAYFMIRHKLFDEHELAMTFYRDKLAAMGMLTACINHEIRNPLYIIKGLAESFLVDVQGERYLDQTQKAERGQQIIEKTAQQVNRTLAIIQGILAFSKRRDNKEPQLESVSMKNTMSNVISLIQPELESSKIQLVSEIPGDLPLFKADPYQLEEVLVNLILNASQAIKTTKKGTAVKVTAAHANDNVKITVADDGPGLPGAALKHIFDPFYTLSEKGTGLGLYVTKLLVERNRGKITCQSQPGSGTEFRLEFPQESKTS